MSVLFSTSLAEYTFFVLIGGRKGVDYFTS